MASKFSCASLSPSAEAVAIPLADVEAEIFADADANYDICDICGQIPPWRELDKERGLCFECAGHLDEGIKYYTEDFAFASIHGKDALRLLVLRQRADNCRDLIAAAAATYDGDLEAHEASVEEKILNKCAAKCLARLPASFEPWWKDNWTHEKWCQMGKSHWPVEKDAPIVQRLASMFVAEKNKVHELKQKQAEEKKQAWEEGAKQGSQSTEALMKLRHEEILANIQRARTEDMEALKGLHAREMTAAQARYAECLTPLLGIRDKMREECEKKCHDARRRGYADGYAFADQKWNPVYKAVCEELELVRKEGANHQDAYIRLVKERDELLLAQADLRKNLEGQVERLEWKNKGLLQQIEEDEQMVQRHLKEIAKEHAQMTAWEKDEIERLRKDVRAHEARVAWHADMAKRDMEANVAEIKKLEAQVAEHSRWRDEANQAASVAELEAKKLRAKLAEADWDREQLLKSVEALRELVGPTQKLMKSNPELFGGEALPPGAASPRPPPIIRLPPIKEEDKERALNLLKALVAPSRPCLLVESPATALPGLEEAEPSSSQTEGMCMALTKEQYKEMFGDDLAPPLPPIVPDEPKVCGTAGCIECPAAEPEPVPVAEPAAEAARVCCVGCGKPKPNYNHPNWPSPITKRFAKHLAKHSGRPGQDPKNIKTHEDALEYIANRGNISVETLLQWTMKHYQSFSEPWTLVEGPNKFNMGTAPATWWC